MIEYIIIISSIFLVSYLINYFYGFFQQEHYHPLKMLYHFKLYYVKSVQLFLMIGIYTVMTLYLITNFWYWIIFLLFFYLGMYYILSTEFVKFKYTKRTVRYFILHYILVIAILLFSLLYKDIYVVLLILFVPIVFLLNYFFIYPLELLINKRYLISAKTKLKNHEAQRVGIVGSYGKTTTKHFIDTLINNSYFVRTSKKSINTLMGITKMINEEIKTYDEVLLFELAATHRNDILKLTKLVNPEIVILTGITYQHTSTFKSINNIVLEKMKVLKSKKLKAVVINNDCDYLRNYIYPKDLKVIRCSLKDKDCDYYYDGKIIYYQNNELFSVMPNIFGDGNKLNYLMAVATSIHIGLEENQVIERSAFIKPVSNRVEIRQKNNLTIIDNSYSSNLVGFENSIKLINEFSGNKIIITPGIVDLGKYTKQINEQVAAMLMNLNIILIKNRSSRYISDYLDNNHKEYIVFNSFKEAYNYVCKNYTEGVLLIENDLPENYLRG